MMEGRKGRRQFSTT